MQTQMWWVHDWPHPVVGGSSIVSMYPRCCTGNESVVVVEFHLLHIEVVIGWRSLMNNHSSSCGFAFWRLPGFDNIYLAWTLACIDVLILSVSSSWLSHDIGVVRLGSWYSPSSVAYFFWGSDSMAYLCRISHTFSLPVMLFIPTSRQMCFGGFISPFVTL